MNEEFKDTLKKVVDGLGKALVNAATLTVETWYVNVDGEKSAVGAAAKADFDNSRRPLARTEIRFDGDCFTVVPLRTGTDGKLEVVQTMLDMHNKNVDSAQKYRSDVMNTFIGLIR